MKRIAYLGDTDLPGPASYLAGILTHFGLPFEYVSSTTPPPASIFDDAVGLYVLSDYPSAVLGAAGAGAMAARVQAGAGLLMLGGWESYHGLGGDYDATVLAPLLPVRMRADDDRRNWSSVILVRPACPHPIVEGLPFDQPPGIGGYNEFEPAEWGQVVLEGHRYRAVCAAAVAGDGLASAARFEPAGRFPLLVTAQAQPGPAGAGRRACLATDVAPHWVGGWVDWGRTRLTVRMGTDFVEIGQGYAEFFRNLLTWCLGDSR